MNCDILTGSIANPSTLNLFAYVNGDPISYVDPFGMCRDEANEQNDLEKRIDYINQHIRENSLYELLQEWNISFTETIDKAEVVLIDELSGKVKATLTIDISYQTSLDANINSVFSTNNDSISGVHEVLTPEMMIPWTSIGTQVGAYYDSDRSSVGYSFVINDNEWSGKIMEQIGPYSTARISSVSYTPTDVLLPSVSVSLDVEVNHEVTVGVIAATFAIMCAPEMIVAMTPTIESLITQIGDSVTNIPALVN
ncbi:MAG: hypothetical protein E7660_02685 [Ruminococcaceae bacterium]|nr:hypothetical protein [Oscillospiraceae bacterium]